MVITHVRPPLIDISIVDVFRIVSLLPFLSICICVLTSVTLHFEEVTRTHCKVSNYLPSISAATGDHSPEKYIWRIGIAYQSMFRLIVMAMEYQLYCQRAVAVGTRSSWSKWMNKINSTLLMIENFALVLLTYVSSHDNYSVHEKCFIVFMMMATTHMLLSCVLYYKTSKSPMPYEEKISLRHKVIIMLINYVSFAFAVYLFFRHNSYCEAGVYSLFAFCEYMTVFSNIGFHYSFVQDYKGMRLSIGSSIIPSDKKH